MGEPFDPYHAWLNIAPSKRPPSPWDLLGLDQGDTDPDRIGEAAAARYEKIRSLTLGPQRDHAIRLLDEISEALVFLTEAEPEGPGGATNPPPLPEPTEEAPPPTTGKDASVSASESATDDALARYYAWVTGSPNRPPSPHEILDIDPGETRFDRIRQAAAARRERVGRLTLGPQREYALRLLKDISKATAVLTHSGPARDAKSQDATAPPTHGAAREQPADAVVLPASPDEYVQWLIGRGLARLDDGITSLGKRLGPKVPRLLDHLGISAVAVTRHSERLGARATASTPRVLYAIGWMFVASIRGTDRVLAFMAGEGNDIIHNFFRFIAVALLIALAWGIAQSLGQ
jgi:hypothetical protein